MVGELHRERFSKITAEQEAGRLWNQPSREEPMAVIPIAPPS